MALQTDIVEVAFAGGLSLRDDPKRVASTKLLKLVNGQFDHPGEIGRRNGLTSTNFAALAGLDALFDAHGEVLGHTSQQLLGYSQTMGEWMPHGDMAILEPRLQEIISNTNSQSYPDSAISLDGKLICTAWQDSSGGVRYQVQEVGGPILVFNVLLNIAAQRPRVLAFGHYLLIFYVQGNRLYFAPVDCTNPTGTPTPVSVLFADGFPATGNYDVCRFGTAQVWICTLSSTAGNLKLIPINASLVVGTPVSVASTSGVCVSSICWDQANSLWFCYWNHSSGVVSYNSYAPGASTFGKSADYGAAQPNLVSLTCNYFVGNVGSGFFFAFTVHDPAGAGVAYDSTTLVTPSTVAAFPVVGIAGRPWFDGSGNCLFLALHQSNPDAQNNDAVLQDTFFVMRWVRSSGAEVVSRLLPGTAGGIHGLYLPNTNAIGSAIVLAALDVSSVTSVAESGSAVFKSTTGVSLLTLAPTVPTAESFARATIFSGGVPRLWDGQTLSELGFNLYPEGITSDVQYGGTALTVPTLAGIADTVCGSLADGAHGYVMTAVNAIGETPASNAVSVTTSALDHGSVALSWAAISGALGYKVYSGTSPSFFFLAYLDAQVLQDGKIIDQLRWVDDGAQVQDPTVPAPTTDTTAGTYALPLTQPALAAATQSNGGTQTAIHRVGTIAQIPTGDLTLSGSNSGNLPAATYYIKERAVFGTIDDMTFSVNGPWSDVWSIVMDGAHCITVTQNNAPVIGAGYYEYWISTDNVTWFCQDTMTALVNPWNPGDHFDITVKMTEPTDTHNPNTYTLSAGQCLLPAGSKAYEITTSTIYGETAPSASISVSVSVNSCAFVIFDNVAPGCMYRVYRRTGATGVHGWISDVPQSTPWQAVQFFDTGTWSPDINVTPPEASEIGGVLPAGQKLFYKVAACTAFGIGLPSNEVSIVLTLEGGVLLSWPRVVGATGYVVYRGILSGTEKSIDNTIAIPVNGTSEGPARALQFHDEIVTYTDQGATAIGDEQTAPETSDGTTSTGYSYQYAFVYEWTDGFGNVHHSAPTPQFIVRPLLAVDATNPITLTYPNLRLTDKAGVRVGIYRSQNATGVLYKIAQVANVPGSDTSTYEDAIPDSDLSGLPRLYTTGGVLENIYPPACVAPIEHRGRLFVIDSIDRNVIWYSKPLQVSGAPTSSVPVEFSDSLQIIMDPRDGDIVALGSMDDRLIIFMSNRIWTTASQGLDPTGTTGDNYIDLAPLPGNTGCIDPGSVVSSMAGTFFRSERGIYLLDRGLTLNYIGAEIEPLLSGQTVTAAHLAEAKHQVRFVLTSSSTVIVYDWLIGQWATWTTRANNFGAAYLGSSYTLLGGDGKLYQEGEGTPTDDGNWIPLGWKSAWIRLSGVAHWQRTRRIDILGQKGVGDFTLNATIRNNFKDSDPDAQLATMNTSDWDSAGTAGPLEAQIHLTDQKGPAVQVEFSDSGAYTGGDLPTYSGLSFEVGLMKGMRKLPASNKY